MPSGCWPGQVGHRHVDPIHDPVRGFHRLGEPFRWFTARVEGPGHLLEVVAVAAHADAAAAPQEEETVADWLADISAFLEAYARTTRAP